MNKYYFFLDETGDHGLTYIDPNFPLFLLCGCLFSENVLVKAKELINGFKKKYFRTDDVILHSRDIRKCNGAFQVLFDMNLKKSFYEDLNNLMKNLQFKIICSAINKDEYIKRYGRGAHDPYHISFSFIMERLVFCTDKIDKKAEIVIMPEMRGRREDTLFISHYNSVMDSGTYHVTSSRFKNRVKHLKFCKKRDNVAGSQIADLTAYPLARYVLNPKEPYIPFEMIKEKIYCNPNGEIDGFGLKVFP